MNNTKDKRKLHNLSPDISVMPEEELDHLFRHSSLKSLKQWLNYYTRREQYEICNMIQHYINFKNK